MVLLNRLRFFQTFWIFFYHDMNQQFPTCSKTIKDSFSGNYPFIANFMDRISRILEEVWLFLEANLTFSKTSRCNSFIKVSVGLFIDGKNVREYQLLRLVSRNAHLQSGKVKNCKPVLIVLITNFDFFETTDWTSHIESQSTVLQ